MSGFVLPGYYKLISAVVTPLNGDGIEILSLIPEFTIEESLDKDSIRGTASVYDNIGLLEDLPLRGEELLTIQIEDSLKNKVTHEFAIYKITDVNIKKTNDGLTYKIHFMSKYSFEAMFRRIIEPFDDTISNIVKNVFQNYYPGPKQLIHEDTIGLFRCIVPNYTPMQTMNFLANRAYSRKSPSCSFRFFETTDNYYFVSDEYLINRFIENKEEIKEFTFSDAVDKSGTEFLAQMKNLVDIKNSDRVNTAMDLASGSYRSNVIEIDLIKRQVTLPGKSNKYEYNYQDAKKKYMSVSGKGEGEDSHTDEFINGYFTPENERRYIVIRDYDDSGTQQLRGDQFIPEIVSNRLAYRHHLNHTIVYAKAHGRLDFSVGDIVNIKIPEFKMTPNPQQNRQLSGYYMINDLTHVFNKDIHQTDMKLVKYDWSVRE
jgi:hypothetical protein